MRSKQLLFYATTVELIDGLKKLENKINIKYVVIASKDSPDPQIYNSYVEIPNLGISEEGYECDVSYLIMEKITKLNIKEVPQRRGGIKYIIDGHNNPDSIYFIPCGVFQDKCIAYGTIKGVDEKREKSKLLFDTITKEMFKGYKKIKSFKVSKGALKLYHQGVRLTPNIDAETTLDLKI